MSNIVTSQFLIFRSQNTNYYTVYTVSEECGIMDAEDSFKGELLDEYRKKHEN